MEKCEKCGSELKKQIITKGKKAVGVNSFCPSRKCNYEFDTKLTPSTRHTSSTITE